MNTWTSLSNEIAAAVEKGRAVDRAGARPPSVAAGVVVAENMIATPAATNDDTVAVLIDLD